MLWLDAIAIAIAIASHVSSGQSRCPARALHPHEIHPSHPLSMPEHDRRDATAPGWGLTRASVIAH
jgi:hypothetical protein